MTTTPAGTPEHELFARISRAADRAERAAEQMAAIAARMVEREAALDAAYVRATRNLVALAQLIGDPTPEELAADAGTRTAPPGETPP